MKRWIGLAVLCIGLIFGSYIDSDGAYRVKNNGQIIATPYASINTAVAAAGTNKETLVVDGSDTLAANLTIPSTLTLKIPQGGMIVKASTYTLTINGPTEIGLYQGFSGFDTGDVTFGAGAIKEVSPELWGTGNTAVQCAINSGAKRILLSEKTYDHTGIQISGKHSVELVGVGKYLSVLNYIGVGGDSSYGLQIRRSSYVKISTLNLTYTGTAPDFQIWVTSDGTGLTQYNKIENVSIYGGVSAGIQFGHPTIAGNDTNVDANVVKRTAVTQVTVGSGIRVYGNNTNITKIDNCAITENKVAGVEIGLHTRGVRITNTLFYGNATGQILVRRENSGYVYIGQLVCELHTWIADPAGSGPFLVVEEQSGGMPNKSVITIEDIISTCNFTDLDAKIIDYKGNGTVIIRNSRFAGNGTTDTYLSFAPASAASAGPEMLITENVWLYDKAVFSVATKQALSPITWYDIGSTWGGTGGTSPSGKTMNIHGVLGGLNRFALAVVNPLPTGVTENNIGAMNRTIYKITVDYTAWNAAAVLQHLYPITLPPKTKVIAVIADTTIAYAGLAGTIQLQVNMAGTDQGYILIHDVKTAAVRKGLLDADLGTNLVNANLIGGGYIPSWTVVSQPGIELISGTGNLGDGSVTNLTAGSTTFYFTTEVMP